MKKYELMDEARAVYPTGVIVKRIRALVDIPKWHVLAGDRGGYIQDESCLSQEDLAWVGEEAIVFSGSTVTGNALVSGKAEIANSSKIGGQALITGMVKVENSEIQGWRMVISGDARIQNSRIYGDGVIIKENAHIQRVQTFLTTKNLTIADNAKITASDVFSNQDLYTLIQGDGIKILNDVELNDVRKIQGENITISDHAYLLEISISGSMVSISGFVSLNGNLTIGDNVTLEDAVTIDTLFPHTLSHTTMNGDGNYLAETL